MVYSLLLTRLVMKRRKRVQMRVLGVPLATSSLLRGRIGSNDYKLRFLSAAGACRAQLNRVGRQRRAERLSGIANAGCVFFGALRSKNPLFAKTTTSR